MDTRQQFEAARIAELVLEFSYAGKMRTFSPFELSEESVIGWDHGRDEVRRYRFDKVANLRPSPGEEYVQPH